MLKSKDLIKKSKRRFAFYSIIGVVLVAFFSLLGFRYHNSIVNHQSVVQSLNTRLTNKLALVNRLALLSERVEKTNLNAELDRLKPEFKLLIKELGEDSENFNEWVKNRSSDKFQSIKDVLKESKLEERMRKYISKASELVDSREESLKDVKENLNFLSYEAIDILNNTFRAVKSKIILEQEKSIRQLNNLGIMLVLFSIFQVFLVWLLVFRPLYIAITSQHSKLADALLKARSASRSKTDFLANISHEIRTPMTAILGYADLIKKEKVSRKDLEDSVKIINQNANHLLSLIDEILDISKIEAGKLEFEKDEVNLSRLLNEVYSLIHVKSKDKGISLIFKNDGAIPEDVYVDPKRVKQILFNIVGNAIKFTDQGFVELTVSFDKTTHKLNIYVKDSGCGIPKNKLKDLFKPFEQADTSSTRTHQGTGLGLVLSRGIAKGMGGNIKIVDSEVGKGTTFKITLDVGKKEDLNLTKNFSTNILKTEDEGLKSNTEILKGRKILVVDDAKENARLFKIYLLEAGADVEIACGGQKAVDLVKENKDFDLVLLDLQMPEKDGYQVIKELRDFSFNKPVVALTAHAMKEEKEKTKEAGFDYHISKPVKPEVLINSVLELVN